MYVHINTYANIYATFIHTHLAQCLCFPPRKHLRCTLPSAAPCDVWQNYDECQGEVPANASTNLPSSIGKHRSIEVKMKQMAMATNT